MLTYHERILYHNLMLNFLSWVNLITGLKASEKLHHIKEESNSQSLKADVEIMNGCYLWTVINWLIIAKYLGLVHGSVLH